MKPIATSVLVFTTALCAGTVFAQSVSATDGFSAPFTLRKTEDKPRVLTAADPVYEGPARCGADGSIYINSIVTGTAEAPPPPGPTQTHLNAISREGIVHSFDLSKIDDLNDVHQVVAYDIGTHEIVMLLYAREGRSLPEPPGQQQASPLAQGRAWFLATFDLLGNYRGSKRIPIDNFEPHHIAVFDNGDVLLLGIDKQRQTPALLRYTTIGGQINEVALPQPLSVHSSNPEPSFAGGKGPPTLTSQQQAASDMRVAVGMAQIVHHRDTLLLMQMNADGVVYQLPATGSIRKIELPRLSHYTADSIIPGQDTWYIRYRQIGTLDGRGESAAILEVSPTTGEMLRRIAVNDWTVWDVACADRSGFDVMRMSATGGMEFIRAVVAPAK